MIIIFAVIFGTFIIFGAIKWIAQNSQKEIFVNISDTEPRVYIKDKKGEIVATIEHPADMGTFPFTVAEVSPNNRFVLVGITIGDGGFAWIYNLKDNTLYEIKDGFGLGPLNWLKDNRVELYSGCISACYCKKLESVNNITPWIMQIKEDLGKGECE